MVMDSRDLTSSGGAGRGVTLMTLPTELHLFISKQLSYPDALSLKHTNRHFYGMVYTGVNLKIEWLIERKGLHLDCPHDKGCDLGSDMRFCRGSVRLLMQRRREHGECDRREGGRGCLVFGTGACTFRKEERTIWKLMKRWLESRSALFWWAVVTVWGVVLAYGWKSLRMEEAVGDS